jgi:hypothetical protein
MPQPYLKIRRSTRRLVIRAYHISDYAVWYKPYSGRLPKQNKFDKGTPPAKHHAAWIPALFGLMVLLISSLVAALILSSMYAEEKAELTNV